MFDFLKCGISTDINVLHCLFLYPIAYSGGMMDRNDGLLLISGTDGVDNKLTEMLL